MHKFPARKSNRVKEYNYSTAGYYYVTICTYNRKELFGYIEDSRMVLNEYGKAIEKIWKEIPDHYPNIELDEFIVMSNHIHGIIFVERRGLIHQTLNASKGVINHAPTKQWGLMCNPNITLGKIIRHFKAKCTRLIRNQGYAEFQWQRNYYEHIVRNDDDLNRTRTYIKNNPMQWDDDENNIKNHKVTGQACLISTG